MIIEIPLVTQNPGILMSWFWGLSFFIILAAIGFQSRFGFLAATAFAYFSINALWIAFYPQSRYANEPFIYIPIAYLSSAFSISLLASMCFAYFFKLKSGTGKLLVNSIGYFAVLNSLMVLLGRISGKGFLPDGLGYSGWLDYSGMNGSLIAISAPFISLGRANVPCLLMCVVATILSRSSIPYGVVAVMALAYAIKNRMRSWMWSVSLIPLFLGGCFDFNGFSGLLDSGLRFQAYKVFMKAWALNASRVFGTGLGSFHVIGKYIQENSGFMKGWAWPSMHSDWLQTLFDGGYIGFMLAFLLSVSIAWRLYFRPEAKYFCAFCGLLACALFDFPFRYFEFSFIGIIAAMEAYGDGPCLKTS